MYTPNKFSLAERWTCAILALALFAYGAYGAVNREIGLPGRCGLHMIMGDSTFLAFAGLVLWAISLLSVIADHYDLRDNEAAYNVFSRWCGWGGVGLLFLSVILQD